MDEVACPHAGFISPHFLMQNSNPHTSKKTTYSSKKEDHLYR